MQTLLLLASSLLLAATTTLAQQPAPACLGEFELCPTTNDCVLFASLCGSCSAGEYLCPMSSTCVPNAAAYQQCPDLSGTHLDWTLSIESRITYLLSNANLTEKIQQLQNQGPEIIHLGITFYNWLNDDLHGLRRPHATIFPDGNGLGTTWSHSTLFNVGYMIGNEARATHNGLVLSGDRGENENGAGMTTYAPNMNLVRDPRWGRAQEVYGEDPFHTGQLTVQYVQGQQGINETETPYMMAGSCCKHYVAYDLESNPVSRDRFDAQVSTRDFWESYLPAFDQCVNEGGVKSIMCSYNSMNGVPTCADPNLLNGILRDRWNFTGFVVSDYDAWANLDWTHHVCQTPECAATMGINAGMDQEGGGDWAINGLQASVDAGQVSVDTINAAFARLFRVRIELGMLDPPTLNPWNYLQSSSVESGGHLSYAREVVRESICLFKNDNNVLPLPSASTSPPIFALIGPYHVDALAYIGNYAIQPDAPGVTTILQAMYDTLGLEADCEIRENYSYDLSSFNQWFVPPITWSGEECANICSTDVSCQAFSWNATSLNCWLLASNQTTGSQSGDSTSGTCSQQNGISFATGCTDRDCADEGLFDTAVASIAGSTHIIVTLGLNNFGDGTPRMEAEGHDRNDLLLPGFQYDLVSRVRAAMTPNQALICVFIHGGTFALNNLLQECDSILDLWYPGSMGGAGFTDVLYGLYNPAGRTAVTWYAHSNNLPDMDVMSWYPSTADNSNGMSYRYFQNPTGGDITIPFGFGLSYTTFAYSNLQVNATSFQPCDYIGVSVIVTNTGLVAGDEVVQVYLQQLNSTVPAPQIRLVGFERVHLTSGSSTTVSFAIAPTWHSVVMDEGKDNFWQPTRMILAGELLLSAGGGQPFYDPTIPTTTVEIAQEQNLDSC